MRKVPKQKIVQLFRDFAPKHDLMNVFTDFLKLASISLNSAFPELHTKSRERMYSETARKYNQNEHEQIAQILCQLVLALEEEMTDILGEVFHILELHNKQRGQFFTPMAIAEFMARCTFGDCKEQIKKKGVITVSEPACGSGVMIIAAAKVMLQMGINPQDHLVAECKDIDPRSVYMTYLQLSLLGIPAIVIQGNSLTEEQHSIWYTPFYVLKGFPIDKTEPFLSAQKTRRGGKSHDTDIISKA